MKYAVIAGNRRAVRCGASSACSSCSSSSSRAPTGPSCSSISRCRKGPRINATRKVVDDLEKILKADPDIEHWSFYVGSGAIRFYLPLDQQLANDFFAQAVVVTKGFKVRSGVQQRILAALQRPEFEQVMSRVSPLELGPPVGWPLKFRVSGPDADEGARAGPRASRRCSAARRTRATSTSTGTSPRRSIRVEVDQDRARALGISSQALSQTINAVLVRHDASRRCATASTSSTSSRARFRKSAPSSKPCAA